MWKFTFSGSALKLLAVFSMLTDHIAAFLLKNNEFIQHTLCTIGTREITPYFIMRAFGRLAFPIFCFLIVEGFLHTHDRLKYGRNLLLFALLSEIPWNLVHSNSWHHPSQNVFFTLFLGYLGMCVLEAFKNVPLKQALYLIALLALSFILHADYGYRGFGFILMLYALRQTKLVRAVVGCCFLNSGWISGAAFIPISLYNGKRGFIRSSLLKFCFYIFYPAHLLIIYLARAL